MPNELAPPPEYAHLRWHFLIGDGLENWPDEAVAWGWISATRRWICPGMSRRLSPGEMRHWVYVAPAAPLTSDDATVERIARAIFGAEFPVIDQSEEEFQRRKYVFTVLARAVLAELMKGPNDAND
tara:strand:+ start:3595 stop:3972 length:378 start_codon:yes stop_codon:yes gene_type:complete